MKQEIPKNVFLAIIAVLAVVVVAVLFRMSGGSSDPSKPLPTDYQGEPGGNRGEAPTPEKS